MNTPAAGAPGGSGTRIESDFSIRKMGVAAFIVVVQMFATSMLPFVTLTYLLRPFTEEFGWTHTQFSLAHSCLMWFGGPTAFLFGWFMDRAGVRPIILTGTIAVGVLTFLLSVQTGALWQFLTIFALIGVFGSSAIGYAKVIAGLFTQHRGKALAIFGVESTLASAGLPFLINWMVQDLGWRTMFQIFSLVILGLVPLIWLFIDEPGAAPGQRRSLLRRPPGPAAVLSAAAPPPPLPGLGKREILQSPVFWIIVTASIIGMGPRSGMQPYMVDMLREKGFSQDTATLYVSAINWIAPFGTLAGGWLCDRIHTAKVVAPFQVISFVGLFLFAMATASFGGMTVLVAAAAFTGFSFGSSRPMNTYIHVRFFGLKSFGFYHGLESMLLAWAMGSFAPLIGTIYDRTGSYAYAYWGMGACLAVGAMLYLVMGPYRYPHNIGEVPLEAPPPEAPQPGQERAPVPA